MRFWVAALFLLVPNALPQTKPNAPPSTTTAAKKTDSSQQPVPAVLPTVSAMPDKAAKPDDSLCKRLLDALVSNWPLVVVGLLGIVVAWLTLVDIQKQTENTRKMVDVALLNARAAISAERPWIIVTAELTEHETVMVYGQIKGRTPATIVRGWGEKPLTVPDESSLDDEPNYANSEESKIPQQMVVVPGDERFSIFLFPVGVHVLPKSERWWRLAEIKEMIFIYGRLLYTDTLEKDGSGQPVVRETRWCFRYVPGSPTGFLLKAGKPAYNRYT